MNAWHDIEVGEQAPQLVNAIVEIPKDSKLKYEFDKKTGLLRLDRYLFSAVHYPADYGFVPQTLWYDHDPLDVFIITHRETYPMTLCTIKVIGVIRMVDEEEQDDKIVAVHNADPRYSQYDDVKDLPKHFMAELHNFLETYKELENKTVKVYEILGKDEAFKVIKKSQELYIAKFGQ